MAEGTHGPAHVTTFAQFAGEILKHRAELANDVVKTTLEREHDADSIVKPLISRTLLTAFAQALEQREAIPVRAWVQIAGNGRSHDVLAAMVEAACQTIERFVSHYDLDLASVVVFLEIVKSECRFESSSPAAAASARADASHAAITAVLALLKARDEGTCSHSQATGMWCERLCTTLGLSPAMTEHITRAGVLHDIGKMGTPDAILLKPGPLVPEEWSIMLQHAAYGAEILSEIPSLAAYAPIVRAHHERIDGTGYPDALAGDDIPFEARVIAVADAFHAMISDRPYRQALSISRATEILMAGRGTQWDARIVDAMIITAAKARNESTDAMIEAAAAPLEAITAPEKAFGTSD
jgi:putative nucleotidyltransferase with HDIG domain